MPRVTRNIELECTPDLLNRATRACISVTGPGGPELLPVRFARSDSRFLVGIPADSGYQPAHHQEVVLLIDDGVHFFDLRAVYIRGRLQPAEAPADNLDNHTWFSIAPTKTLAWDYGALRRVDDER